MRIYETTFILSPQADDAAFDRQIKSVTELISRYEGKIIFEDRWGIRRLAYPIRKFTQGYYTRLVFEGNNNLLTELDRFFRIEESYIRYLTVQFEGSLEKKYPALGGESGAAPAHAHFDEGAPARHDSSSRRGEDDSASKVADDSASKVADDEHESDDDIDESTPDDMGPDEDEL
ncbi:MAG: 30S ribosomal protein S6 [Candidatus Zixiibacteriota bacterium]